MEKSKFGKENYQMIKLNFDVKKHKLENGLEVVTIKKDTQISSINAAIKDVWLSEIRDDYIDGKLPSIKIVLLQDFSNELGNILKSYEPEKRDILNIDKKESV